MGSGPGTCSHAARIQLEVTLEAWVHYQPRTLDLKDFGAKPLSSPHNQPRRACGWRKAAGDWEMGEGEMSAVQHPRSPLRSVKCECIHDWRGLATAGQKPWLLSGTTYLASVASPSLVTGPTTRPSEPLSSARQRQSDIVGCSPSPISPQKTSIAE